jgi:hypothetical protein
MSRVEITELVAEADGDGLLVYGLVDGVLAQAHAWRSHLYADHAEHDRVRRASAWYDDEGIEVEPQLIPASDRLETDEQRRAYLAGLLAESARQQPSHDHLLGAVEVDG